MHNLLFLFTFVWAIVQHDNEDSVFLCLAINLVSLVLDTVILGARYPTRSPPYHAPHLALCGPGQCDVYHTAYSPHITHHYADMLLYSGAIHLSNLIMQQYSARCMDEKIKRKNVMNGAYHQ